VVLTDTHTHLYADEFLPDRAEMIQRALSAGVSRLFLPNIDSNSIPGLFELVKHYPQHCFPMMGLHPCSVNEEFQKELKVVEYWLTQRKFYAIGEVGIDLYWDTSFAEQQKYAFDFQVQLAKKYRLPVIIHTRNAFKEAYEIILRHNDKNLKGIFHCFSGNAEEAEQVISLGGFKLGIGGVLTFKNAGLDKVLEHISPEHMVLETDAPYLAPVPYRGKRNESSYLSLVAAKLGELKKLSVEEIAAITTANSKYIFGN
jgi:TatD DNase family protein